MRAAALALALVLASAVQAAEPKLFFDDFGDADTAALAAAGWTLRAAAGHPGISGGRWAPELVSLIDDPARPGNRLLRLEARTDGTPQGTAQTQLCQARKFLRGTYAARIRFNDRPQSGLDGDPVIQTFYAVAPLKHDFDPHFSEVDFEYLPNGGWGSPDTRLYAISWQTVQIEPWQAFNASHEERRALDGWHVLMAQVTHDHVRVFLDGRELARHAGRNVPVQPMAISFNLWFSPGGLLPASAEPRVWRQDVDWVFHAREAQLSPAQVDAAVQAQRRAGRSRVDTVPPAVPALDSRCDF